MMMMIQRFTYQIHLQQRASLSKIFTTIFHYNNRRPLNFLHYQNHHHHYYHWDRFSFRSIIINGSPNRKRIDNSAINFSMHSFVRKSINDNNDNKNNEQQRQRQRQKDQFIHDHLNSSQDSHGSSATITNTDTLPVMEQDLVSKEPPRERLGIIKAIIIIIAGIYFGAWVAMIGAKLLEDLDIFVQDRDGDDD